MKREILYEYTDLGIIVYRDSNEDAPFGYTYESFNFVESKDYFNNNGYLHALAITSTLPSNCRKWIKTIAKTKIKNLNRMIEAKKERLDMWTNLDKTLQ